MSTLLIIIFLICFGYVVYYVINLLMRKRLTENFAPDEGDFNINLDDSHYFLKTAILPGKKDIANLKETNPNHSNYYYVDDKSVIIETTDPNVVTHRQSKLLFPKNKNQLTCIDEKNPIRRAIQHYQPFMYDEAEIINYYDYPFYRDWRYPERPIDVKFAANPEKYCEEHPNIYPSYKHLSKW
jgi:hypothetical protein